jgi:hypothetical protein
MRLFEKVRPEVYLHAPQLRRDKKTGSRLWRFTLIVTLTVDLAEKCDVAVAKAWQYITEKDSRVIEVCLAAEAENMKLEFFAQRDDADNALLLSGIDLVGLRLTREGTVIEFWAMGEQENNSRLHAFMKEYAYTRIWVTFTPIQKDLDMQPAAQGKLPKS